MAKQILKPVIFVRGKYGYYSQNTFQQNLLLKAMQVTVDPRELRKMTGLRTVAALYRTLDKLAIRREYQEALAMHGLTVDNLVKGLKQLLDSTKDQKIKLQIYTLLFKTLGIDQYVMEEDGDDSSWELMKNLQKSAAEKQAEKNIYEVKEYEVAVPSVPKEEEKKEKIERETARSIYGI